MLRFGSVLSALLLQLSQPVVVGLATGATLASIVQSPAHAQTAEEVARVAKAITVRIEGATQGSGVIIGKEGAEYKLLTAWHVVEGNHENEEVDVILNDGSIFPLNHKRTKRLGNSDMAISYFNSSRNDISLADLNLKPVQAGDVVFVAGTSIDSGFLLSRGFLLAATELGIDNGYQLLYTNKTEKGMSGGPIFDQNFKLVGIHGRGEKAPDAAGSRMMKTGINQGMPISYFSNPNSKNQANNKDANWDYYFALFMETGRQGQINQESLDCLTKRCNFVLAKTMLRLLDMMEKSNPKNALAYVFRVRFNKYLQQNQQKVKEDKKVIESLWAEMTDATDLANRSSYFQFPDFFNMQADRHLNNGNFEKVIEFCDKAIYWAEFWESAGFNKPWKLEYLENQVWSRNMRSDSYLQLRKPNEAIQDLEWLVSNPNASPFEFPKVRSKYKLALLRFHLNEPLSKACDGINYLQPLPPGAEGNDIVHVICSKQLKHRLPEHVHSTIKKASKILCQLARDTDPHATWDKGSTYSLIAKMNLSSNKEAMMQIAFHESSQNQCPKLILR